MKAIGNNIIIKPEKITTDKTKGGLIIIEKDREDIRYKKAIIHSVSDDIKGLNVVTGKVVNMVKSGIIDPLLVTKSALRNAASVATTILSTDCVINNLRTDASDR